MKVAVKICMMAAQLWLSSFVYTMFQNFGQKSHLWFEPSNRVGPRTFDKNYMTCWICMTSAIATPPVVHTNQSVVAELGEGLYRETDQLPSSAFTSIANLGACLEKYLGCKTKPRNRSCGPSPPTKFWKRTGVQGSGKALPAHYIINYIVRRV